jgi:hypothetical protein
MLPSQFVEFLEHTKTLLQLLYRKQEIKNLILSNLVRQVWLLIFYSNTKLEITNCSYFYEFFGVVYGLQYLREANFHLKKIVLGPHVSVRSLYKKI